MDLISESNPKARKNHQCIWCGEPILTGEIHYKMVGVFQGDFQSNRFHFECKAAMREYYAEEDCRDDDGFEECVHKRGSVQEKWEK